MATAAVRKPMSGAQWRVLVLLVVCITVNYFDRSNLSVAAPPIRTELGLSPAQLGLLLSGFFWTYAGFLPLSGWLVDRFHVGWVLAIGYFVWSAATAATGMVSAFWMIFALRLLVGASESVAYPAFAKIFVAHFPEHHRGVANGLIDAGSKIGPTVCTLLGGLAIAHYGWRVFFIVFGLASLAWVGPWLLWMPHGAGAGAARTEDTVPVRELLANRDVRWSFLALFCANYYWYFLLTWLPSYFVMARHVSMERMARLGALAYLAIAVASTAGGFLSDRWIAAGSTPTRVRKGFTAGGLLCATVILPVAVIGDMRISMSLLIAACMAFGCFAGNHWALTQTLAGPLAAGKWTGLQNAAGNLAGVVSPAVTGWVVQQSGRSGT
ncbi:MAG: MFS transporter, partial [Acidobacteria bacterium]|nr:MFS transporter [Acidobacteriota bacterium]